jgi:excisionase family DNA binding protein
MNGKMVTPAEAAQLKGVSKTAIYNAIADGRLPHRRILGRLALRERDVLAWTPAPRAGRRKGTPMSIEAKARISEGQKRRWARRK